MRLAFFSLVRGGRYRLRVAERFMGPECVPEEVEAGGGAFEVLGET
jgi:hypothetical protein